MGRTKCYFKVMMLCIVWVSFSASMGETQPLPNGGNLSDQIVNQIPQGSSVVANKTHTLNGKDFTFLKLADKDGNITAKIFNSQGKQVSEGALPSPKSSTIHSSLQEILNKVPSDKGYLPDDADIEVVVALKDIEEVTAEEEPAHGRVDIADDIPFLYLNGAEITEAEMEVYQERQFNRIMKREEARLKKRQARMQELIMRNNLDRSAVAVEAVQQGRSSLRTVMKKGHVAGFAANNKDLIAGIEKYETPRDELSSTMLSTRIDPYALNYSNRRGSSIGIYMSESGCPDTNHINNYTRLFGSATDHSKNVSAILRGASPDSYVYCRASFTLPSYEDLYLSPRIYVENHSWGSSTDSTSLMEAVMNSFLDAYTTADRDFDDHVYGYAVAVFNSAGNSGYTDGYVGSPAKALNVITVGNYDDSNNSIAGSSSYKDPATKNEKPELSAPGTNVCAGGFCMTGTSMASPHAAAFAADLMSDYSWLRLKPYYLKAFMLAGATKSISGGLENVGLGGVDFYSSYYDGTHTWWEGSNSSFSYFDSNDVQPNNGYIERRVYLSAYSKVRIALAWLNRGSYIYSHSNDAHPIGMDLDLTVYNPSGQLVAGSYSFDNPFEYTNFTPTVSGTYTVKIKRYSNRDTSSKLHMGLSINWY